MKSKHFTSLLVICVLLIQNLFAQTPNFNFTQTCFGSQTSLVATSSLPDSAISTWQWDLDGNGSYEMSGKSIISILISNDTVPVKLKITPKVGLADSITKNVIIDPLPQVNFIANNLCESRAAIYISQSIITSGSIAQFLWDFNNDGIVDDNSNDTVSYICGPAQTYVTKLTCVSDKGCSSFTQKTTTVYPNPVAAFSSANTCLGNTTAFTNSSTAVNPDYYKWDFGDGNLNVASGNTNHSYASAGNYNVELIAVTQAGCRDTALSVVTINSNPAASFQFSGDTTFYEGGTVTISVAGGAFNYAWSTGEVSNSISVSQSGNYSCSVTDGNGCFTNLATTILVHEVPDTIVVLGVILTPNEDNINDALIIQNIDAYSSCDLKVYNMWNDEVYSTTGYKNDWEGKNKNDGYLPAGSYYYLLNEKIKNEKTITFIFFATSCIFISS